MIDLTDTERGILRAGFENRDNDGFFQPATLAMERKYPYWDIEPAVRRLDALGLAERIGENVSRITDRGIAEAQREPFAPSTSAGSDAIGLTSEHEKFIHAAVSIAETHKTDEVNIRACGKVAEFDEQKSMQLAHDLGDFKYLENFNSGGGAWLTRAGRRWQKHLRLREDEDDASNLLEEIHKTSKGSLRRRVDAIAAGSEWKLPPERVRTLVQAMERRRWIK